MQPRHGDDVGSSWTFAIVEPGHKLPPCSSENIGPVPGRGPRSNGTVVIGVGVLTVIQTLVRLMPLTTLVSDSILVVTATVVGDEEQPAAAMKTAARKANRGMFIRAN
jgi:hypothetical protein